MFYPGHPMLLVLNGRSPDRAIDLVIFLEEQFGEVRRILAGYSRN